MRKRLYIGCFIAFLFSGIHCFGQVSLNGPACVTNNTEYLYIIGGNYDSSHTWNLCVTGGSIDSTDSSCITGRWDPFVKISWTDSSSGSIQLSSDSGNVSLNVNVTTQLIGGIIDSSVLIQVTDSVTTPASIVCSVPKGGSCNPSYLYQWQQSTDNLQWSDIAGATGQNLAFTAPVAQSGYFRRKVKAEGSDAVAYSSLVAAVFISQ